MLLLFLCRFCRRTAFVGCMAVAGGLFAAEPRTVIFFGDSLTAGYGLDDPSSEAYPARIQEKINAAGLGWRVVNAGLSGETTSGGLRRVDWILRQPVDLFVLALGANDGLRGIDPALSRENLQKIIDRVRAKYPRAQLVLAGMQMPSAMGLEFSRSFEQMFPDVAAKNDATLIPFLLEGVGGSVALNQPDRIHPTARGHAIIADQVWKILRPLL
ncbi:arylesterase [Horticoccus sp. 23ND18S-11]|uniref:arylesterase n=1 Tax=Horticoccus sp. 23ND18S-11 TaxID=3391832 RepID=UPI0039C94546